MKKFLKFGVLLVTVIFTLLVIACSDTTGTNNTGDEPVVSEDGVLEDISSKRPNYKGIVIKIDDTKIPEGANMRRIYVTHKGFDGNSNYRLVAMHTMTSNAEKGFTSSKEWGYPFVNGGTEYKIKVEYSSGWNVLTSHEIETEAKSGLGELWFGSPWPDYKFEDGKIKFSEATKQLPLYLGSSTHAEMYLTDEIISENFSYFYTHTNVYKGNDEWVNCENDDNTIKLIDRTLDEFMYNWDYENNASADEYYLNWIVMFRDAENKYGEYRLDTVSGPKFSIK